MRGLALGALALIVFYVVGESSVRLFDVVDRLNGFPRRLYIVDADEPRYRLRPGLDEVARGVRVRTNRQGFRGRELKDVPELGRERILVLGDSVAFGYRLEEEQAFPVLLEQELAKRSPAPVEVLNAGVEGYNTRAELALLRKDGFRLQPRTVIVLFNLNDFDDTPSLGARGVLMQGPPASRCSLWLAEHSELYLLLDALVRRRAAIFLSAGSDGSGYSDLDRFVSALRKQVWREPDDGRLNTMVDSLRALRDETAARGIRLVFVIVPDGDQIGTDEADLSPQKRLGMLCEEEGLDCLDLRGAFEAMAAEPLFFDIMHPNAAGHGILAVEVAAHLTKD